MKRWLAMIGMGLILASSDAQAGDYESSFGFSISVPEVWLVLTRTEVAKNADLFLGEESPSNLQVVPPAMREAVFQRIQAGQLEIFYRQEGIVGAFVDNVNIMTQAGRLPASSEQLGHICRVLPSEFSRVFGRPVGLDACEIRELVGLRALYLQFDGAIDGTKTMQYQVARGADETLILTATASNPNLTRMLGEFEKMVGSIRLR